MSADDWLPLALDSLWRTGNMNMYYGYSVSQFFSIPLLPQWKLMRISSSLWAGGGVHPGKVASPSQGNTQTSMHTLIHTPKGNLERPINITVMFLDCGRKLEYPVRTHACTGRTCKLHAERPPARS
ncbi:hypothetical protein CHARACLAT_031930 [Characodon lateralis]|uniref:Uncharacterized protein n=1 Tax=Characodon lateralis TaxID=208331 RepID=A0ABU7EQ87_9TELE|nr:hypothetical protein [Characodon lateralis]